MFGRMIAKGLLGLTRAPGRILQDVNAAYQEEMEAQLAEPSPLKAKKEELAKARREAKEALRMRAIEREVELLHRRIEKARTTSSSSRSTTGF